MARAGKRYGAKGILNTNWGDLGNPASIEMSMYSLILGATMGWNTYCEIDENYRKAVAVYHYGNENAVDILMKAGKASQKLNWRYFFEGFPNADCFTQAELEDVQNELKKLLNEIENSKFINDNVKNEFIIAFKAQSLMVEFVAKKYGYSAHCVCQVKMLAKGPQKC